MTIITIMTDYYDYYININSNWHCFFYSCQSFLVNLVVIKWHKKEYLIKTRRKSIRHLHMYLKPIWRNGFYHVKEKRERYPNRKQSSWKWFCLEKYSKELLKASQTILNYLYVTLILSKINILLTIFV